MTTKDETKAREALDEAKIDAIEARANAATEGPWFVTPPASEESERWGFAHEDADSHFPESVGDAWTRGDAFFIAHARTDIPTLIAEVRRLRAALASAERVGAEGERERIVGWLREKGWPTGRTWEQSKEVCRRIADALARGAHRAHIRAQGET